MTGRLQIGIFAHSWRSDWNHGNAHFLRGLASELAILGHGVRCYEPINSWSLTNLLDEGEPGRQSLRQFDQTFPKLDVRLYRTDENFRCFALNELQGVDVILVHEWNSPQVVNTIAELKRELRFRLLFHDTHHRAYTSPLQMLRLRLDEFDGVLAFGNALSRIYRHAFGVSRVWTFHEAADTRRFHPFESQKECDLIWVGNWGDEERTRELEEFLIGPCAKLLSHQKSVYGVRYPAEAQKRLTEAGIDYRGYLSNLNTPEVYAASRVTMHVPRRYYTNGLSGIPTIRVFEALACGIPLVCAPWADSECLFRPNEDYLCVSDGHQMLFELQRLLQDESACRQLAANGLETIRRQHTCAHRAQQFLEICQELG